MSALFPKLKESGETTSVIVLCMCVAQLKLHPEEWTNINKQVQEAYKLSESMKLRKDKIPSLLKDTMESLRRKDKNDKPDSKPDKSTAGADPSTADTQAPDAAEVEELEDPFDDDGSSGVPATKGKAKSKAKAKARASKAPKAQAKPQTRQPAKKKAVK